MPIYVHGVDMFEKFQDVRSIFEDNFNTLVVTTNVTMTTPRGKGIDPTRYGVMGRGCAKQLAMLYPDFPLAYAKAIGEGFREGIFVQRIREDIITRFLIAMVVKDNWWQKGTRSEARILELVESGLIDLVHFADHTYSGKIIMPYPAIGNAELKPERVKPLLDKYLDERFYVHSI